MMEGNDVLDRLRGLVPPVITDDWPNLPLDGAEGSWLHTTDGRRIADMMGGFATVNAGHGNPEVVRAARQQMEQLIHAPVGVMASEAQMRMAEELIELLPGDMNMLWMGNSGSEAIEAGLKLARRATGRQGIISFYGSFHGRTLGATSVTASKNQYREGYAPLLPGVHFLPFPYCFRCPWSDDETRCRTQCLTAVHEHLRRVLPPHEVAAVIIEPVQGEGGFIPAPAKFLAGLRELCDEYGILLIFDEIQSGFGRTGRMFAADLYGVAPDIICLAKAIASGFPLSAVGAPAGLMRLWPAGSHGSTYGGNSVACAAGLATLKEIGLNDLPERSARLGEEVLDEMGDWPSTYPAVGDVRGRGLMIGVEYVDPTTGEPDGAAAGKVLREGLRRGFLFYGAGLVGHVVRLTPPLNVPREVLEGAIEVLREITEAL